MAGNRVNYNKKKNISVRGRNQSVANTPPFDKPAQSHREKTAKIKNKKVSRNSVRKSNKKFRIIPLALLITLVMSLSVGCYALWHYGQKDNDPLPTDTTKAAATAEIPRDKSLHAVIYYGSDRLKGTEETITMPLPAVSRNHLMVAPLVSLAQALNLTVASDASTGEISVTDGDNTIAFTVNSKIARCNGINREMDNAAYLENDHLMVPVSFLAKHFGFAVEYTPASGRADIYVSDENNHAPTVKLTTTKEVYAPGELVDFQTVTADEDEKDEVVDMKWQNHQERYFEAGTYEVSLSVKDSRGKWSEPVTVSVKVEGTSYEGANKIPVLMYHFLAANDSDCAPGGKYHGNAMIMPVSQFRQQMEYLKNNGFKTLTVSELMTYERYGQLPPSKSVVVIFDDGYENNYTLGFPVLKELGLKANMAPVIYSSQLKSETGLDETADLPRYTFAMMKEMYQSGLVEIGSHTYHGHGPSKSYQSRNEFFMAEPASSVITGTLETEDQYCERVLNDCWRGRALLREQVGEEHPYYVYPYGKCSKELAGAVEIAGYSCAFIIKGKYMTADSPRYSIHRLGISPTTSIEQFARIVNGDYPSP